jgi:translation initiation factor IF-3
MIMIKELDVVTLTRNIPEHGLPKGSQGAVVHCYNDEQAFEVEFVAESGETLALLTLEKADIQSAKDADQAEILEILANLPDNLVAEVKDFAEFLYQKQQKAAS